MNTAVLFLIFNRPDTTAQVMEAIRAARPSRLYVAADGPRDPNIWYAGLPSEELEFPLKHPSFIVRNVEADRRTDRFHFGIPSDSNAWQRMMSRARQFGLGLKAEFRGEFAHILGRI